MGEDKHWLHHDHQAFEDLLEDCRAAAEAENWRDVKRVFNDVRLKADLQVRPVSWEDRSLRYITLLRQERRTRRTSRRRNRFLVHLP